MESHFAISHFICPYEICKAKCFVAFRTEDELRAHLELEHKQGGDQKKQVKANALLGFIADDPEEADSGAGRGRGRGRGRDGRYQKNEANPIKDSEGIDFGYYFSNKYSHCLINRRKKLEDRKKQQGGDQGHEDSGRGGRGRGRGDRGRGRGRGRGDRGGRFDDRDLSRQESSASTLTEITDSDKPLNKITNPEDKLSTLLNLVSEFIK